MIPKLIQESSDLLSKMYDDKQILFSYSSIQKNNTLLNDFYHPSVIRYTINSLLGIQKAKSLYKLNWDLNQILNNFISKNAHRITNPGDKGIFLYILSTSRHEKKDSYAKELLDILIERKLWSELSLQDISWAFLGLIKYIELNNDSSIKESVEKLFKYIDEYFLNKDTFIPYHNLRLWRKAFVSFGAVTYYLLSLYEYSRVYNDQYAKSIFKECCLRIMSLQGEYGEWPWFIDTKTGKVLDWYEGYSVHQDSMAMLFLFPAINLGIEEAKSSIIKSYKWLFGANELGVRMLTRRPFFIYRSIRRKEKWEREKRFLRATVLHVLNKSGKKLDSSYLEINRECRSYHLGWILFVWSGVDNFNEFIELEL
jgi:hypothetical protein